jgi:DNA-binding LacI/PurR family transcriptional regulator
MSVSIKDIARVACVSHSTVSRALQNPAAVNPRTVDRIRQIARSMGYRPNVIARSLATQRTRTIGVVVTSVADPFVAEVVTGIEEVAQRDNYAVFLANSNADPDREISAVRSFEDRRVDGVVVMASRVGALYLPLLQELNVPIVLVDNQHPGDFAHSISINDREGARLAVRHLGEFGHTQIAYIGDRHGLQSDQDRFCGYSDEVAEVRPELVVHGDGCPEGGLAAMESLLALRRPPTAVFCYNDMTAVGALRCLHSHRVRVPEDISVIGFDDLTISRFLEPPLTTIRQPRAEMGRDAATTLLKLMRGEQVKVKTRIAGKLILRDSTGPSRKNHLNL